MQTRLPITDTGTARLVHAWDALAWMSHQPDAILDAVITDPPYSSGGLHLADRAKPTGSKYVQGGKVDKNRPSFGGDQRSARGWDYWSALWLADALRLTKPGGYLLMFCDWRQIGGAINAVEAGGWIHRGVVAWDKTEAARAPHKGYFKHQAEYVVWGTAGPFRKRVAGVDDGPFPGVYRMPVPRSDKHHQTSKPVALMSALCQIVDPGAVVLDPFMGAGTTGVAAVRRGCHFIGVEREAHYHGVAVERLRAETADVAVDSWPPIVAPSRTPCGDIAEP